MSKFVLIRIPRRWLQTAAVLAALAVVLAPVAVAASHQFTDVSDSNIFHSDIAWLADNGITKGCNPPSNDQFCPDDNVTREQMAAFMKRLATGQIVDTSTLKGNSANELTSDVHSVWHDDSVTLATAPETVVELTGLPAGSYLIIAKTSLGNTSASNVFVDCELVASPTLDRSSAILTPLQIIPATLTLVHTYTSDGGTAQLRCDDGGKSIGIAQWSKITAISVDTLTNTAG